MNQLSNSEIAKEFCNTYWFLKAGNAAEEAIKKMLDLKDAEAEEFKVGWVGCEAYSEKLRVEAKELRQQLELAVSTLSHFQEHGYSRTLCSDTLTSLRGKS